MMPRVLGWSALAFAVFVTPPLPAQAPAPNYLASVCYTLKPGTVGDMMRNETVWARAIEKAPNTTNLLGMTSVTGPSGVCWLSAHPSMAALESFRQVVAATDARFEPNMKGYAESVSSAVAVQRPDLSFGEPNTMQKTMLTWNQIRMRPGSEGQFVAAVKALAGARARAGLTNDWRIYRVLNGAPDETWWVLSSQPNFAALDRNMADDPKFGAAVMPDDQKAFAAFFQNVTASRSDLWAFDSAISAIKASDRAQNAFWKLAAPAAKK